MLKMRCLSNFTEISPKHHFEYTVGRLVIRKVLKIRIWEVPPADWLILWLHTAQAGPRNSHGKK